MFGWKKKSNQDTKKQEEDLSRIHHDLSIITTGLREKGQKAIEPFVLFSTMALCTLDKLSMLSEITIIEFPNYDKDKQINFIKNLDNFVEKIYRDKSLTKESSVIKLAFDIWRLTLCAISHKELSHLGGEMWRILREGAPGAKNLLELEVKSSNIQVVGVRIQENGRSQLMNNPFASIYAYFKNNYGVTISNLSSYDIEGIAININMIFHPVK